MRVAERIRADAGRVLGSIPSMGPQHESCGKLHAPAQPMTAVLPLQWGRNMRVAESLRSLPRRIDTAAFNGAAT